MKQKYWLFNSLYFNFLVSEKKEKCLPNSSYFIVAKKCFHPLHFISYTLWSKNENLALFLFFILELKKILSISRLPPSKRTRTLLRFVNPFSLCLQLFLHDLSHLAWKFDNRMIIYVLWTLSLLSSLSI